MGVFRWKALRVWWWSLPILGLGLVRSSSLSLAVLEELKAPLTEGSSLHTPFPLEACCKLARDSSSDFDWGLMGGGPISGSDFTSTLTFFSLHDELDLECSSVFWKGLPGVPPLPVSTPASHLVESKAGPPEGDGLCMVFEWCGDSLHGLSHKDSGSVLTSAHISKPLPVSECTSRGSDLIGWQASSLAPIGTQGAVCWTPTSGPSFSGSLSEESDPVGLKGS